MHESILKKFFFWKYFLQSIMDRKAPQCSIMYCDLSCGHVFNRHTQDPTVCCALIVFPGRKCVFYVEPNSIEENVCSMLNLNLLRSSYMVWKHWLWVLRRWSKYYLCKLLEVAKVKCLKSIIGLCSRNALFIGQILESLLKLVMHTYSKAIFCGFWAGKNGNIK